MKKLTCYMGLLLSAGFASRAEAQNTARCDSAAAYVSRTPLAPWSGGGWGPWGIATSCGRMDVFITALSWPQITSEADQDRVARLFDTYHGKIDGALFAAYSDAVSNGAASDAFRIEAMRALGALFSGLDLFVPQEGYVRRGCRVGNRPIVETIVVGAGKPPTTSPKPSRLPSDALVRATATFAAAAASAGSDRVRFAARCWQDLFELRTPVDLKKVSVSYICGTTFHVKNANVADVDSLRFVLGKNLDSGEFTVGAKSEYTLLADTIGTIRVYRGTKLIGTAKNGGTVCK